MYYAYSTRVCMLLLVPYQTSSYVVVSNLLYSYSSYESQYAYLYYARSTNMHVRPRLLGSAAASRQLASWRVPAVPWHMYSCLTGKSNHHRIFRFATALLLEYELVACVHPETTYGAIVYYTSCGQYYYERVLYILVCILLLGSSILLYYRMHTIVFISSMNILCYVY